jgi:hypothetical protein
MRLSIRPTLATVRISKEKLVWFLLLRRPLRPDQPQTSFIQTKASLFHLCRCGKKSEHHDALNEENTVLS